MRVFETTSAAGTEALAETLARELDGAAVLCLSGDLGVGKTAFARGFARGLKVSGDVVSPTFTLVHEYGGTLSDGRPVRLCHFDIYRLETEDDLFDIGWDDYLDGSSVCLVEWADQLAECMPPEAEWVLIEKDLSKGTDYRRIKVGSRGEVFEVKHENIGN